MSRCSSESTPPLGPPVCTPLNFLSLRIPPPISQITSRRVIPNGTSTRPVLLIWPTRLKIFVPLLPFHGFSLTSPVPTLVNHSQPLLMILGILDQVSTLLSVVGLSQRPCSTVWMCLARGSPGRPSME